MTFYRYELYVGLFIKFEVKEYVLFKETPKGYWIIPEYMKNDSNSFKSQFKKWIPKISKKRYAYPSKKDALENYLKRTSKYIKILDDRLSTAKQGKIFAERLYEELYS